MKKIRTPWHYIADESKRMIDGTALAVFRIAFFSIQLGEVLQTLWLQDLLFGRELAQYGLGDMYFSFWIAALVALIVGYQTRLAAFINYCFVISFFGQTSIFEYHMDYAYSMAGFFSVLAPLNRRLSIDKFLGQQKGLWDTRVAAIWPTILAFNGIGIIYFDSIFFKFGSYNWTHFLGMWKYASLPQATWLDLTWILNWKWFSLALGGITLIFELIFIFVIWWHKSRVWMIPLGLGLHLGIVIAYPIPWFGLAVTAIFFGFVPNAWWGALGRKIGLKTEGTQLFPQRTPQPALPYFILFWLVFSSVAQFGFIQSTGLFQKYAPAPMRSIGEAVNSVTRKRKPQLREYWGITAHPVFMDAHFDKYNHIIGVWWQKPDGSEELLPYWQEDGQPGWWTTGRMWVHYTFRVVGPTVDQRRLKKNLGALLDFWAHKKKIPVEQQRYVLRYKSIDVPMEWQADFLSSQLKKPWRPLGEARKVQGALSFDIKVVEDLP